MSRKIFFTFFICIQLLWSASAVESREILVVQNHRIKPYGDAFDGFKSRLGAKIGGLVYTVRDSGGAIEYLGERKPDLVLAIGRDALKTVKKFSGVPIVYLMVLNPSAFVNDGRNITGVSMTISPEKQVAAIHRILPSAKRIGILYDPNKSASFVRRVQNTAKEFGIELVAKEVAASKIVPAALNSLKGIIDAFWMIPDTTVVTPDTLELIMLFSLDNKLPVCTFSKKYLELGALMSMDISAYDMGKQAGELAVKILAGTRPADIPPVEADTAHLFINESVARKLRIPIDEKLRDKVRFLKE